MMPYEDIPAPLDEEMERRQPKPEELMLRMATRFLNRKQRRIWEWYTFGRKTQIEIAKLEGSTQSQISKQIQTIEKRVTVWVTNNMGAYELLKKEYGEE